MFIFEHIINHVCLVKSFFYIFKLIHNHVNLVKPKKIGKSGAVEIFFTIGLTYTILYESNEIMKEFDRLMLMNDSSEPEPSLSSKKLSDNEDKPDLHQVLISEARIHQMLRMRINKLKNERRQNLNHERKFSITKMLLKLQQQRNEIIEKEKCM